MFCAAHSLGRHKLLPVEGHSLRHDEEVVVRPFTLRPVNGQLHHRALRSTRLQLPVVLVAALEDEARGIASPRAGDKLPRNFPAAVARLRQVKVAMFALGALVGYVRLEFSGDRVAAGAGAGPLRLDARTAHKRVAVLGFVERDCDSEVRGKKQQECGGRKNAGVSCCGV